MIAESVETIIQCCQGVLCPTGGRPLHHVKAYSPGFTRFSA
jgi:hypothetical protein